MINLLTIFIPAYNEEGNLETCVRDVMEAVESTNTPFEILIVDDASTDHTGELAERLRAQDDRISVIHHAQNRGIGGGFCTAIENSRGDWMLLIPADIAMDLDDLHLYIEAAAKADIVVGLRSNRDDYSLFRKLVSWVNIHLIQVLFGMKERQFQFICMYRTNVLRGMQVEYVHSAFFLAEVLIKAKAMGMRLVEVEIRYTPRKTGRATGVSRTAIFRTVRDMFHFWLRRLQSRYAGVEDGKV